MHIQPISWGNSVDNCSPVTVTLTTKWQIQNMPPQACHWVRSGAALLTRVVPPKASIYGGDNCSPLLQGRAKMMEMMVGSSRCSASHKLVTAGHKMYCPKPICTCGIWSENFRSRSSRTTWQPVHVALYLCSFCLYTTRYFHRPSAALFSF